MQGKIFELIGYVSIGLSISGLISYTGKAFIYSQIYILFLLAIILVAFIISCITSPQLAEFLKVNVFKLRSVLLASFVTFILGIIYQWISVK